MTEVYWLSKLVVIEWVLVDVDGASITNAIVSGTITLPDGSTTAAIISHTSGTNVYRASYDPTTAGKHAYRLVASGTADSAEEGTFDVRPPPRVAGPVQVDPSTDVGMIRLLIPDTDLDNLLFTDAEVTALLTLEASVIKRAVAAALDVVASNEAMVGKVIRSQDLSTDGAKVSAELRARATELRRQVNEDDVATAGGLDIVDFVDPFTRRQHENTEPGWL